MAEPVHQTVLQMNFMKDLIKSLPAMHDLAAQAGIELPQILGKVDSSVEEKVIEE